MSATTFATTRLPTTHGVAHRFIDAARATAFWFAIGFPLVHFALLLGGRPGSMMLGLALHGVALVAGHEHRPR